MKVCKSGSEMTPLSISCLANCSVETAIVKDFLVNGCGDFSHGRIMTVVQTNCYRHLGWICVA